MTPLRALVLVELGDEVDPAADLEGADRQVVLVLDEDLGADELGQGGVGIERRGRRCGAIRCRAAWTSASVGISCGTRSGYVTKPAVRAGSASEAEASSCGA